MILQFVELSFIFKSDVDRKRSSVFPQSYVLGIYRDSTGDFNWWHLSPFKDHHSIGKCYHFQAHKGWGGGGGGGGGVQSLKNFFRPFRP